MSDNRASTSTKSTEPEQDLKLESEVKEESEKKIQAGIDNTSTETKALLEKAGSSAKSRRGK
jgi:activator of 2-hydroxyglutaryl-CoA dehydratase